MGDVLLSKPDEPEDIEKAAGTIIETESGRVSVPDSKNGRIRIPVLPEEG